MPFKINIQDSDLRLPHPLRQQAWAPVLEARRPAATYWTSLVALWDMQTEEVASKSSGRRRLRSVTSRSRARA